MQRKCAAVSLAIFFGIVITIHIPYLWGSILNNSDDGTEVDETDWYEDGFQPPLNYLGRYHSDEIYDGGFRFHEENLNQADEIAYARLRFASWGSDMVSTIKLLIEGVLQESPTTFSQDERPSQKTPKTGAKIAWEIDEAWLEGTDNVPLYYSSPNIAPIINEILALPNWGTGPEGKTLIITIKDNGTNPNEINMVFYEDFSSGIYTYPTPAILEIYKTVYDTFLGKELLGRITDTSVTVNLYSLIETDTYIEYGTTPGSYTDATPEYLNQPAEQSIEIILDNLAPDIKHYYRLAYKKTGDENYEYGQEHTFHTQRPQGSSFVFAINADEHFPLSLPQNENTLNLYKQTLQNIAIIDPDFLISLGDFAMTDWGGTGRWIKNFEDAKQRYLNQRECLDDVAHSIPFYLVLGNHEGEVGWQYDFEHPGQNDESKAVISTKGRKEILPNPLPDEFYTGNSDIVPEYGLREDYFAWEWGDALFVVLDPFWYTKTQPQEACNNWEWTLGKEQYDWLYETLHNSDAKWKFVFIHHLTSSNSATKNNPYYGRGGIEIAKYKTDGLPSFEWGGEDEDGNYVFDIQRAGWTHGPIHDVLVENEVTILFHGHDHFFAKQDLDGIVYQECPQPGDADYSWGMRTWGNYQHGVFHHNSGHIRVTVYRTCIKADYVQSFLPGDGENGIIAYSYILPDTTCTLVLPDTLHFGEVVMGTAAVDTFYICNQGTDTLEVTELDWDHPGFDVEDNTPFPIAPGQTEPVEVTFAPLDIQSEEIIVEVFTDAGDDHLVLWGEGAALEAIQHLWTMLYRPHLYLEWEPVQGATHYRIYRHTEPLFIPSLDDSLAMTTACSFVDSQATGNPAVNYYYLVFSANDLIQSPPSNRVGEVDRVLINGQLLSRSPNPGRTDR